MSERSIGVLADKKKARLDELARSTAEKGGVSLFRDALRRLRRNPVAITGAVLVGLFLLVAIFAPLIAPHDPVQRFQELTKDLRVDNIPGPTADFPLGSDPLGRDYASRLI